MGFVKKHANNACFFHKTHGFALVEMDDIGALHCWEI